MTVTTTPHTRSVTAGTERVRPAGGLRATTGTERPAQVPEQVACELRAEEDLASRIGAVLSETTGTEAAAMIVVNAPVGAGVTGAIRRALTQAGVRGAWVHSLPERADGGQRVLGHTSDEEGEQVTVAAGSMAEALDQLAALVTPGAALVVDAFHELNAASANTLVVWAQAAKARGAHVIIGYHDALDDMGVGALLQVATSATWLDVRPLRDEVVRADFAAGSGWASPGLVDLAVEACAGNASMVRALRRGIAGEAVVDAAALTHAYQRALEASAVRVLAAQGIQACTLAALTALVRPDRDQGEASEALKLNPAVAARLEKLLAQLGLAPAMPTLAQAAGEVVTAHIPVEVRRAACRVAHALLDEERVGQGRLFALRATVGDALTGCLDLARAAFDEAWAQQDHERAQGVAATLMSRTDDPVELAWARAARLRAWAHIDWAQFAANVHWCTDPEVARQVQAEELSEWLLDVECTQARQWLPRTGTGEGQRIFDVAISALAGVAGDVDLRALDEEFGSGGLLGVPAPVASRLALGWLALADYEAAHRWASVAAFTAAQSDRADCAVGHLIAAHATLRLGQFATADQQAKAAAELFGELNASGLEHAALVTRAHVAAEAGEPMPALPEAPAGLHGALTAYRVYVLGRANLQAGRHDVAARTFFDCGRSLRTAGTTNPALLNWRPHMIALFRASGQRDFMRHVEDDLVADWQAWARVAPEAAARRVCVLGPRAQEIETPASETPAQSSIEKLSAAELRVVELVVQGASNRDAAKTLYLSKRTVDTHLGNVYRKLGVSCRDELRELMERMAPRRGGSLSVFG